MSPVMEHIDASSFSDLTARVSYMSKFLDLTSADSEALVSAAPLIAPLVPTILEAVYVKLLSFDITAQAFVPKNTDYTGETVQSVQELTLEHPQIAMRKDFLKRYLVKLVTTPDLTPASPFWVYLDRVSQMHTGMPGFKHRESRPDLRVEYIHMGALLGFVVNVVIGAVLAMDDVPNATKSAVLQALNKVIWVQNDLFARWYVPDLAEKEGAEAAVAAANAAKAEEAAKAGNGVETDVVDEKMAEVAPAKQGLFSGLLKALH